MDPLEQAAPSHNDDAGVAATREESPLAMALLREISSALADYLETGETAVIDLKSLPMLEADRAALADLLGEGEVTAMLDVAGESEVRETGHAGVWWVRHFGADRRLAAEQIEVTAIPDILLSHRDDIAAAADRLAETLKTDRETDPPEPITTLDRDTHHV
ncbi:hydrogenase expression/formation protein [Rhodobium gokarnense]|uniref:HupH hydrogenase expression protein C-terminal domain-containing protein n=1 Tax=Rhodobium gokarnense TaxID=364296 RepID=A0ABT3HIK2_9HYPH|nr:hydrogenase expression/formation protein [Rhodobium gokarnense]MCW2310228.1 hypothetical protein [Rhodobium gokarnense]